MDIDAALLSLQERDNWRRRRDVLSRTLAEVRARRNQLRTQLRRIKRELAQLAELSAAISSRSRTAALAAGTHATAQFQLPAR
ncbi:MAG TPA: hypothetical protein VFF67_05335 [Thermoplasmata archaeon]|nr:hypothetical protein [Thermoplasmata archaeon]